MVLYEGVCFSFVTGLCTTFDFANHINITNIFYFLKPLRKLDILISATVLDITIFELAVVLLWPIV